MNKPLIQKMPRLSLGAQIILGLAAGLLEFAMSYLCGLSGLPLFMDSSWTIAASFFGAIPGVVCAVFWCVINALLRDIPLLERYAFLYVLCSLTIVLIVRLFMRPNHALTLFRLCIINFVIILVISIEGGIIYTFISTVFDYYERSSLNSFFVTLVLHGVPLFLSSILGRIGINFIDKTLCLALSLLWAALLRRILGKLGKKAEGGE